LAIASRLTAISPAVRLTSSALYRTASGVVAGRDGAVLLVDPGVLPDELAGLAAELTAAGLRPAAGVATHAHWDHVLWAGGLGPAPRFATRATAELVAARRGELVERPLAEWGDEHYVRFDVKLAGRLEAAPDDGAIPWPGPPVRLMPAGGHCPGHAAVLVPDDGVVFAGDMLSELEVPLPTGSWSPTRSAPTGVVLTRSPAWPACRWWCPATAARVTPPSCGGAPTPTGATWTHWRPRWRRWPPPAVTPRPRWPRLPASTTRAWPAGRR
jgi:glyoxylase-like metal-dependent hydrolase (beta-lactamase superfamily II)